MEADLPVPEPLVPDAIYLSATGMERLTGCEERWVRSRIVSDGDRAAASDPMRLGTLWHRLAGAWRTGRDWRYEWDVALAEDEGWEPGYEEPEIFARAHWMMERYVLLHGETPPWPSIAQELPFDLPVPGVSGVRAHGYIDGLVDRGPGDRRAQELWLWEDKSFGRRGRERRAPWDPQLWLYMWAARHLFDVQGAIFEGASTYRYAKDKDTGKEPAPEKSFVRIEVPYDQCRVDLMLENLQRAARRAKALVQKPALAVKSVGEQCMRCEHFRPCLGFDRAD